MAPGTTFSKSGSGAIVLKTFDFLHAIVFSFLGLIAVSIINRFTRSGGINLQSFHFSLQIDQFVDFDEIFSVALVRHFN